MKFNWGVGVFVLYSSFVILILFLVFKSVNTKVDLVTEDYYQQELKYQDKIDQKRNAAGLEQGLRHEVSGSTIFLAFPPDHQLAEGTVMVYRPSNKSYDKTFDIKLDEDSKMIIAMEKSPIGLYKLKINWSNNSIDYYVEEDIYLSK
ncbi:MAG: hypothetical protein DRI54_03060 [Bacteroidetes bacterium]|nr:MAG: hypothetical protein DRI54_03060 [Bacteroidota bacterium]